MTLHTNYFTLCIQLIGKGNKIFIISINVLYLPPSTPIYPDSLQNLTTSKWRITYKNVRFIQIECNTFDEPLKLKQEVCASVRIYDLILTAQCTEHRRKITKTITVKILQKNRWTWFYVYKKSKIILLVFGKQTLRPCESIRVRHWTLLKLKEALWGFQQEDSSQTGSGKAPITVHFIHQIIIFTTFNLASFF